MPSIRKCLNLITSIIYGLVATMSVYAESPQSVLDQQQTVGGWSAGSKDQWQSFTAGKTGLLTRLDINVNSGLQGKPQNGEIRIYAGEGTGGDLLATQAVTFAYQLNSFQSFTFEKPARVTAGQQYTYRFSVPQVTVGWVALNINNPYKQGRSSRSFDNSDYLFKTYVLQETVAQGTWQIGKVTNNTEQHVMFSFHVPNHGSIEADALQKLTMVGVLLYDDGILSIDPHGNTSGCDNPTWRTEIQFGAQVWEFYYNTGTRLDIEINPNRQFKFTPGPGGQIKPEGQAADCQDVPGK